MNNHDIIMVFGARKSFQESINRRSYLFHKINEISLFPAPSLVTVLFLLGEQLRFRNECSRLLKIIPAVMSNLVTVGKVSARMDRSTLAFTVVVRVSYKRSYRRRGIKLWGKRNLDTITFAGEESGQTGRNRRFLTRNRCWRSGSERMTSLCCMEGCHVPWP